MDDIDKILEDTDITVNGESVKIISDKSQPEEEVNIDDLINEVELDEEESFDVVNAYGEPVDKQVAIKDDNTEIDLEEKYSLANRIVENSLDVIKKADKVFTNFSDDVMHGKDRSTSSKEMLIKALEIQNSANKNLIDLARTLDKENSGNTNILIGASVSHKRTGVDPNNLRDHFKK